MLYSYHKTTLVLNEFEFKDFLNKYIEERKLNYNPLDEDYSIDQYDFVKSVVNGEPSSLYDCFIIKPFPYIDRMNFTFTPYIRKNGDWNVVDNIEYTSLEKRRYSTQDIYIVEIDYPLDNAIYLKENIHYSFEYIVQEFKNKMEKYLPDNFNWENHIGISHGIYY